ncbi:MAG: hypothetical protein U9P10_15955 [Thermodesulfobacteriota bacterium]|nr:hypothetical protein [Thermodesulfobacteriota bacterium]
MVKKHIFAPEPESEDLQQTGKKTDDRDLSRVLRQVENQLEFTGIIFSSDTRKVLIKDKRAGKDDQKSVFEQGEPIMDMIIDEIGRNYIVLKGKGETVKLNLYKNRADRPAPETIPVPVPDPAVDSGSDDDGGAVLADAGGYNTETGQKKGIAKTDQGGSTDAPKNIRKQENSKYSNSYTPPQVPGIPFMKALQQDAQNESTGSAASSSGPQTNPFLEAIKKARQQNN